MEKQFRINPQIGKAKYSISYQDGIKTHSDGSPFWDIEIFRNKVEFNKAIKKYTNKQAQ
jgi:hypothetical protein